MGKRTKNRAPAYRVGDVTLGWRDGRFVADIRDEGTSKRQRIRLAAGLSEDEAKRTIDRVADSRRLIQQSQSEHTCDHLWQLWLADRAKDNLSNDTYAFSWRSTGPVFGHRAWNVLTPDDFRAYAQARFDLGRAPATVHAELSRLKNCFKWAARRRLIGFVPDVWTPSRGKGRKLAISIAEARALLTQAGDPHVKLFILLLLTTGARHKAILDLTWDRVDFERGTIQYDERVDSNPMHKNYQKGRATVPFGPAVRVALELAFRGRQTDHVIEHGGKRLTTARDGFANAVWRAGLNPKVTPHTIRHSVATWAKERGDDFHKIASLLGHGDSRTSEIHYTHVDPVRYLTTTVEAIDAEFDALSANEPKQRRKGTRRGPKPARSVPTGQSDPPEND